MSNLNVIEYEGVLVVDSRLIAQELGIQHKNFLATLNKYIDEIEEDWGQVAFKTETVINSVGASNSVKYAFLTEQQATLLMTYSRNTITVRQCKRQLVKAFDRAKVVLGSELQSRVAELENNLEIALKAITSLSSANAQLQSQMQNLLPISSDFMPPGWNAEVWKKLPPQDKYHFRFISRRRRFRPSNQGKDDALPAITTEQMKQKQKNELQQVVGEISQKERERIEAVKQEALRKFWSQQGEQNETDVPF